MAEASAGKDSVTGHWEMMGIVLDRAFPTFPHGFPPEVIAGVRARASAADSLGNVVASGTAIIDALGPEHVRTGAPIVYTSADSVFQIAAHESVIPIDELYRMCGIAFEIVGTRHGRRPRHRAAVRRRARRVHADDQPPRLRARSRFSRTLLDRLKAAGHDGRGHRQDRGSVRRPRSHARDSHDVRRRTAWTCVEEELTRTPRGLIAINLVDFDTQYGHRNDVAGYADNLERFDARLARAAAAAAAVRPARS